MHSENDNTNNAGSDDAEVQIGAITAPGWQFAIYYAEAARFLAELDLEIDTAKKQGVTKNLVRAVHTLAGISNTLGVEPIAVLGYAIESWLTALFETQHREAMSPTEQDLLDIACAALATMVQATRRKEGVVDNRTDVLAMLQAIDTETREKRLTATMNQEVNDDGSSKDDWLEQELHSLDRALTEEQDPMAGWTVDLDALTANIKSAGEIAVAAVAAVPAPAEKASSRPVAAKKKTSTVAPKKRARGSDGANPHSTYVEGMFPPSTVVDSIEPDIKDIFIEEANEIFEGLPDVLNAWIMAGGVDNGSATEIKRALHTLKGSSRMAGYFRFGAVVHNIETVVENGHAVLAQKDIPHLVQAVFDSLTQELRHIEDPSKQPGITGGAKSGGTPLQTEAIRAPAKAAMSGQIILPPRVQHSERAEDASINTTLRVPTEKIDMLSNHMGRSGTLHLRVDTSVARLSSQIKEMSVNMIRLRRLLTDVEVQAESQMRSRLDDKKGAGQGFDPLEFDRFTRLQELTRMTAEAIYDIENSQRELVSGITEIHDALAEQTILADDMQHAVMSVRTVPVGSLVRRLDQVVRLACNDTGKKAALHLDTTVEVDSGVLNKIVAPLEHLLRNAIAHGIEAPDVRIARGKVEKGSVILKVRPRGNDIVFTLSDDGAGINRAAVEKKAREKGIIEATQEITQDTANKLIFDAGFSTADTVSEIAGRGVGMDVVASELSAMGGQIHVESHDGGGTTFELIVPSYMSVISMVPVKARTASYAIPSALVRDVIVVRGPNLLDAYEKSMLDLEDMSYPFYGLSEASGLEAPEISRSNRVMLVDDGSGMVAIHIDSLESDRNLVMKPLCRTIASLPGLLGASVAGDGSPLLVINPVALQKSVQRQDRTGRVSAVEEAAVKTHADFTIMVIDDSLTVRRITQRFLQRVGFKVVLAIDGLDAIEKIAQFGIPDLFLTDIEMPNMDGFQLSEHIRTSVSKTVPIVMISSRSIDKYSEHARSLGVNRSLGKPYQEPELLEVVEELVGLRKVS
jgi:chemosensory pili system protein ChpA (sensor histidine kinase/response regulator)